MGWDEGTALHMCCKQSMRRRWFGAEGWQRGSEMRSTAALALLGFICVESDNRALNNEGN
jgi:hypothetical protein